MKVIEITIDLTNPNAKPSFDFYNVTKETESYLHCKAEWNWERGRRFYKKSLDQVHYPKKLVYTYQFKTEINDYLVIEKSKELQKAMEELKRETTKEIDYYKRHLETVFDYYNRNYKEE